MKYFVKIVYIGNGNEKKTSFSLFSIYYFNLNSYLFHLKVEFLLNSRKRFNICDLINKIKRSLNNWQINRKVTSKTLFKGKEYFKQNIRPSIHCIPTKDNNNLKVIQIYCNNQTLLKHDVFIAKFIMKIPDEVM